MYEIYDNRTLDSMIWQHVPSADCKSRSTVSIGRWVLVEWVIPLLPLYWLDIPVFSGLCVTNVLAPFFDCLNRLYFVGIFHCLVWTPADIWKKKNPTKWLLYNAFSMSTGNNQGNKCPQGMSRNKCWHVRLWTDVHDVVSRVF